MSLHHTQNILINIYTYISIHINCDEEEERNIDRQIDGQTDRQKELISNFSFIKLHYIHSAAIVDLRSGCLLSGIKIVHVTIFKLFLRRQV